MLLQPTFASLIHNGIQLNVRFLHTSRSTMQEHDKKKSEDDDKEKPNNKEEDEEQKKLTQIMVKMFTWTFTMYLVLMIFASFFLPNSEKAEVIYFILY